MTALPPRAEIPRQHHREATSVPLDELFRPRSVAVVGASSTARGGPGFVDALKAMGFPGPIYPVNPKAGEIAGLRCYPSLSDVPTDVDYVISSVPALVVPEMIEQAIDKDVRLIHFFTAGFSETGDPDRAALEHRVMGRLRSAGVRVLGPNCMGLYIPRAHLSFMSDVPAEPGSVAMISQSGANASEFVHRAMGRGIRFSTLFSYGNGADLSDSELLEYAASDADTEIITMYVEGLRDGRAFLRALRHAASAKPVIVLKGGRTEAGSRAARSHTGSLGGAIQIFDAACRQAGAIRVSGLDELVDLTVGFRFLGRPAGPRVAMALSGGGTSVLAADDLAAAGLDTPPLSDDVRAALAQQIPVAGTSIRNPVDMNIGGEDDKITPILEAIGHAPNIDVLYFQPNFNWRARDMADERTVALVERLSDARDSAGKPLAVVVEPSREVETLRVERRFIELCGERGLPVFPSPARAGATIARILAWHAARE